ncbi:MAG: YbaK/EbsC family protein [Acidimicrobiales bacterium]
MDAPGPLPRRAAEVAAALDALSAGAEVRHLGASTRTATEAAAALGCEVGAIASSLVFVTGDQTIMIVTSGAHRVDLDHVAGATGLSPLRRATPQEVREATGQAIGGVSPIGHPAPLPTFVDVDLAAYADVWAAAGTPHSVFATTYDQLLALTGGTPLRVVP